MENFVIGIYCKGIKMSNKYLWYEYFYLNLQLVKYYDHIIHVHPSIIFAIHLIYNLYADNALRLEKRKSLVALKHY